MATESAHDANLHNAEDEETASSSGTSTSPSGGSFRPEKRKRRNPSVLVQWIEEHPYNPYPTKTEKQHLAYLAGMTLRQLNDWFANARRNIKKMGMESWRKKKPGNIAGTHRYSQAGPYSLTVPPNYLVTNQALQGEFNRAMFNGTVAPSTTSSLASGTHPASLMFSPERSTTIHPPHPIRPVATAPVQQFFAHGSAYPSSSATSALRFHQAQSCHCNHSPSVGLHTMATTGHQNGLADLTSITAPAQAASAFPSPWTTLNHLQTTLAARESWQLNGARTQNDAMLSSNDKSCNIGSSAASS